MSATFDPGARAPFSLRRCLSLANQFFHGPTDLRYVGFFRIALGTLIFLNFALLYPYVERFWTDEGFLTTEVAQQQLVSRSGSIFYFLGSEPSVVWPLYFCLLVQSLLLAAGIFPRVNLLCVFLLMGSFQHRNALILDGEDVMFRLLTFWLFFMPLNDAWSLSTRFSAPKPDAPPRSDFARRCVQITICVAMFAAGFNKLDGNLWWSGEVMEIVSQLDDFYGHFPMPIALYDWPWLARVMTWSALLVEIFCPVLIWFKELRLPALVLLVGAHLGMEYMMNVYLFEFVMVLAWTSHLERGDGARLLAWGRALLRPCNQLWKRCVRRG